MNNEIYADIDDVCKELQDFCDSYRRVRSRYGDVSEIVVCDLRALPNDAWGIDEAHAALVDKVMDLLG